MKKIIIICNIIIVVVVVVVVVTSDNVGRPQDKSGCSYKNFVAQCETSYCYRILYLMELN